MNKVTARVSPAAGEWLVEAFGSKGAGAEYLIEAIYAVQRRCISEFIRLFSPGELRLMIDCFNGHILSPRMAGQSIPLSVEDSIRYDGTDAKWGVKAEEILEKLGKLSLAEKMLLEIWVKGFWEQHPKMSLEAYLSPTH